MSEIRDFDRFLAEREAQTITLRAFGRDMAVPRELPFDYMLLVDRLIQEETPISGAENLRLMRRVLSQEDYEYLIHHPDFRASHVWELIVFTWLSGEGEKAAPKFTNEDAEGVREAKNAPSA